MPEPVKFIHVDEACTFTGHQTRRGFYMWFKRAVRRHPSINVLYRNNYVEESTFHALNAADAKQTSATPIPSARSRVPVTVGQVAPQVPGGRPIQLPLTRFLPKDD